MTYHWYDLAGNLGVAMIIGTYLALQMDKLNAKGRAYSALNGLGAGLVLVSLYFEFNMSAFLVESFWVVISIYGLLQQRKRAGEPDSSAA